MIALLGALKQEISGLRKRMTITETVSNDVYILYRGTWKGREVLLAQTGMGRRRAQATTQWLVDHYPITALVSFGFAGALTDELKVGDVVLYSSVHCANVEACPQRVIVSDETLLERMKRALEHAAVNVHCRPGVTAAHAVLLAGEKDALADSVGASVVDMESYWVAEIASQRQIPWAVLRSVSDAKSEKLLPFADMLTGDGNVVWGRAAGYFLRRPHHLSIVWRLARNAKRASTNLSIAIDSVIGEL